MNETCGYTIVDQFDVEQPCDRPATGWRWYQGHEHEDMLDAACDWHENEGGRRIHEAEAEVARLLAECVDRESERGDLRDRVQKAEGAVARVEALKDGWFKRHPNPEFGAWTTWAADRIRAAIEDPS